MLIRANSQQLSFNATDLDLEVIETIAAEVGPGGSTTVPAHMLYDIVRKLPDGSQIILEASGERAMLAIRAGRSRFTLQTLPESDFPDLAAGDMTHRFVLAAADLKRLIDKTQFAISTEETRYYLNGIYVHTAGSDKATVLRAVATDGHRLAQVELPLLEGRRRHAGHHRAAQDGRRGAAPDRGRIGGSRRRALARQDPLHHRQRGADLEAAIDGTFPDYGRVIPLGNDKELKVDKKEFEAAVDRVSTVSSERGRAVKLALTSGKLVLSVTNPDSGSATEELEVEYDADPLDIGFNSRYLLDIAAQIEGEDAVLKLADLGSPGPWSRTATPRARSTSSCPCGCDPPARRLAARAGFPAPESAITGLRMTAARIRRLTLHTSAAIAAPACRPTPGRSCWSAPMGPALQDQSHRGDLVSGAGPRVAARDPGRGGVPGRRRVLGGLGRDRRRARPRHAGHRHRAAARR